MPQVTCPRVLHHPLGFSYTLVSDNSSDDPNGMCLCFLLKQQSGLPWGVLSFLGGGVGSCAGLFTNPNGPASPNCLISENPSPSRVQHPTSLNKIYTSTQPCGLKDPHSSERLYGHSTVRTPGVFDVNYFNLIFILNPTTLNSCNPFFWCFAPRMLDNMFKLLLLIFLFHIIH